MAMAEPTPTLTEGQALLLAQWLSPAYPVGAYAFSHGLEAAVASGWVQDHASLRPWIADVIAHGSGRSDAVILAAAYRAETVAALETVDRIAKAYTPAGERRRESERLGTAFADVTQAVMTLPVPRLTYPVALGWAAAQVALPVQPVLSLYLQAMALNMVSAAVRLSVAGPVAAQTCLARMATLFPEVAAEAAVTAIDDLAGAAFLSDIAAMRHETQEPRLFQS